MEETEARPMVLTCQSCGKKNRIDAANLAKSVRCGACQTALTPIAEPINADTALFDEIREHATLPVLVDFWAEWCGPCRRAAPEVHRTAETMAGRARVVKVNTEAHPDIATRYQVEGIPNFVVLSGGRVVFQQPGLVDATTMTRWLESAAEASSTSPRA
jgi:thioredoxin 2